jgi:hypothetical protein
MTIEVLVAVSTKAVPAESAATVASVPFIPIWLIAIEFAAMSPSTARVRNAAFAYVFRYCEGCGLLRDENGHGEPH